jgi:clan AA aspartic protease
MTGQVDDYGRCLVSLTIVHPGSAVLTTLDAWIDTGCTGELVIPKAIIGSIGLTRSGQVKAGLGDGSVVLLDTYTCLIEWFGKTIQIEAVSNDGRFPLIGVGLMEDFELTVNYPARTVTLR